MNDLKNIHKIRALAIAQKYLGMTPRDLGCDNFAEMNEMLANEIISFSNQEKVFIIGSKEDILARHIGLNNHNLNVEIVDYPNILDKTLNQSSLNDLLYKSSRDLNKDILLLNKEIEEIDDVGYRGVTNNRKVKKRKKAKNGKNK